MTTMSLFMSAMTALEVPAAVTAYGSAEHEWSNQVTGGFWGVSWHQISGERCLLPCNASSSNIWAKRALLLHKIMFLSLLNTVLLSL